MVNEYDVISLISLDDIDTINSCSDKIFVAKSKENGICPKLVDRQAISKFSKLSFERVIEKRHSEEFFGELLTWDSMCKSCYFQNSEYFILYVSGNVVGVNYVDYAICFSSI